MKGELTVTGPDGSRTWSRTELMGAGRDGSVPVAALLPPRGEATHVSFETVDGDYRASIPWEVVESQAILVHSDESGPLGVEDGGPFRLLVPDGRTLCWNVKSVSRVRLTVGAEPDSVPENPPH